MQHFSTPLSGSRPNLSCSCDAPVGMAVRAGFAGASVNVGIERTQIVVMERLPADVTALNHADDRLNHRRFLQFLGFLRDLPSQFFFSHASPSRLLSSWL